jgi:SAM-dependent methyltransferase
MQDRAFKRQLVDGANLSGSLRILDFGCGTGTLTRATALAAPTAEVFGLDADPAVLEIARRNSQGQAAEVHWLLGTLQEHAPLLAPVDRILTSLVLHHLRHDEKRQILRLIRDILRPGGELHVADFGKPAGWLSAIGFLGVRLLDGFDRTRDNAEGKLRELIEWAGFEDVVETGHRSTLLGTVRLLRARRP